MGQAGDLQGQDTSRGENTKIVRQYTLSPRLLTPVEEDELPAKYEAGIPWSITMYGFRQVNGMLEVVPEETLHVQSASAGMV